MNGNDFDEKRFQGVINDLIYIKNQAKKFKSAEEIEGTEYMAKGGGVGEVKAELVYTKSYADQYYENGRFIMPSQEQKLLWEKNGLPSNVEKVKLPNEITIDEFFGKSKEEIKNKLDLKIKNGDYDYLGEKSSTLKLVFNEPKNKIKESKIVEIANDIAEDIYSEQGQEAHGNIDLKTAIETVKTYGYKGKKLNDIAKALVITMEGTQ
jgi:hypothetical protein